MLELPLKGIKSGMIKPKARAPNAKRAVPKQYPGMTCPLCHNKCKTTDTRGYWTEDAVHRRRECLVCKYRFSTIEHVTVRSEIVVTKLSGIREKFDLTKIEKSLKLAFANRVISPERINRIAVGIAESIDGTSYVDMVNNRGMYKLVSTRVIGQMVMESLKELDLVAYIRYASVFNRFSDVKQFQTLLDTLG